MRRGPVPYNFKGILTTKPEGECLAISISAPINSKTAIQNQIEAGNVSWIATTSMLLLRLVSFAAFQAAIAVLYALGGAGSPWSAVLAPSFFLAAQHCALPLIFDTRFILYRFAMFLGFALLMGITLRWRLRLLPYLMVSQALLDLLTIYFVFSIFVQ
jgi:hypothetical protein